MSKSVVVAGVAIAVVMGCSSTSDPGGGSSGGSGGSAGDSGSAGEGGAGQTLDTTNFCDKWAAQCPTSAARTPDAVALCKTNCEQGQMLETEDCAFPACAVETGKCDNDEKGDPSILACIRAHAWFKSADAGTTNPCTRTAGLDSSCATQGKPGKAYLCGAPGDTPGIAGCVNGATNGQANGTFCCP